MKLGIINSAFGQAGVDTKTGLEHIARIGFDVVDVFTEALTITEEEIAGIESTCAENNLPIVSLPIVSPGSSTSMIRFATFTSNVGRHSSTCAPASRRTTCYSSWASTSGNGK